MWGPTQNLVSIGPAVLTFIGYKQTDRQVKYIYRYGKTESENNSFETIMLFSLMVKCITLQVPFKSPKIYKVVKNIVVYAVC